MKGLHGKRNKNAHFQQHGTRRFWTYEATANVEKNEERGYYSWWQTSSDWSSLMSVGKILAEKGEKNPVGCPATALLIGHCKLEYAEEWKFPVWLFVHILDMSIYIAICSPRNDYCWSWSPSKSANNRRWGRINELWNLKACGIFEIIAYWLSIPINSLVHRSCTLIGDYWWRH